MNKWRIYHNPKCGTCRKVLSRLEAKGIRPQIVEYLKTPPSAWDLDELLKMAQLEPEQVARKKEEVYAKLRLGDRKLSRAEWLKILSENPSLIERPIVVKGNKAILARPAEKIDELF